MKKRVSSSPFLTLDQNKWADLVKYGSIKHYDQDYIIVHFNSTIDRLYYILKGNVKYNLVDPDGQEKVLAILGKGTIFGEGPLFTKSTTSISAVAVNDCQVCEFNYEQVIKLLQVFPELAEGMINSMTNKMQIMVEQLSDLSFKCSKERVANLIYKLAAGHGQKTEQGIKIPLNFSHQQLADLAGCSRVSITRGLNALKTDGLIDYSRSCMFVKNLDKLDNFNK